MPSASQCARAHQSAGDRWKQKNINETYKWNPDAVRLQPMRCTL